jgi:hypothetical protein
MSKSVIKEITDELVLTIYSWFQSAMRSVGRDPKLPKARNISNTYPFRATKMFAHRCYNELELDDKTIRNLIYDIVRYAAKEGILSKGTQMLVMSTVVDICRKSIEDTIDAENNLVTELQRCKQFMATVNQDLAEPINVGGYSRFVYWTNLGYITPTYIALSRSCMKVLNALPLSDRHELPSDMELLRICTHTVDNESVNELRKIMGTDLRVPPTVRI